MSRWHRDNPELSEGDWIEACEAGADRLRDEAKYEEPISPEEQTAIDREHDAQMDHEYGVLGMSAREYDLREEAGDFDEA